MILWMVISMYAKSYSESLQYENFGDRLNYLILLDGNVDSPRHMSNTFYKSKPWIQCRDDIIRRDLGMDLGVNGVEIDGKIIVHHINPITEEDILYNSSKLFNHENLIAVSVQTHNIIHYGYPKERYVERQPNDTKLW